MPDSTRPSGSWPAEGSPLAALIEAASIDAPNAGRGAALLVGPHLLLGTWLAIVPDHRAFLTNQIVTLIHTFLALASLPLVALWIVRHARRMHAPAPRDTTNAVVVRWALASAVTVAMLTGLVVLWSGDILSVGKLHAACGILVGVPLAIHLGLSAQRRWALAVCAVLATAIAGPLLATRYLPPAPIDARVPAFEYQTRSTDLYESAAWCGECHTQDYAEWKRSSHARTLTRKAVRESWLERSESAGWDLASIGRVVDGARPAHADQAIFSCESCHSPTSFYGDDPTPALTATNVSGEGVTCSFCHTLRDVTNAGDTVEAKSDLRIHGTLDLLKYLPQVPRYVSAPETVRPYLGQRSRNIVGRTVAGWLIRWRPSVHSRDYHSPVLDSSRGCLACHGMGALDEAPEIPHKTYISWKQSAFNTGDPKTTTTCLDCHMTRRMTGKPEHERRRAVPWGPVRDSGRSHFLIGGDVVGAIELGDDDYARMEHQLNLQAARLAITRVARGGGTLDVGVAVRSEMVGHYLPSMETHERYLWVQVRAIDDAGHAIASTPPPNGEDGFDGPSPFIFRCTEQPKPECDTLLRPQSTREFTAHLQLPEGARPVRLDAELHIFVDPQAIATASAPFPVATARNER